MEHLNASQGCLEVGTMTDNLDFRALCDNTSLNTSGGDSTASGDGEDIYDAGGQKAGQTESIEFGVLPSTGIKNGFSRSPGHKRGSKTMPLRSANMYALTKRKFEPVVASINKFSDLALTNFGIATVKRGESGTHDDGGIVAIEVVGG